MSKKNELTIEERCYIMSTLHDYKLSGRTLFEVESYRAYVLSLYKEAIENKIYDNDFNVVYFLLAPFNSVGKIEKSLEEKGISINRAIYLTLKDFHEKTLDY